MTYFIGRRRPFKEDFQDNTIKDFYNMGDIDDVKKYWSRREKFYQLALLAILVIASITILNLI